MPAGTLTYNGVTLIGAPSSTLANGEGWFNVAAEKPRDPVEFPVELAGVAGLGGVLRSGNYNTEEASALLVVGAGPRGGTLALFTSQANAQARINAIEAARINNSRGTLTLGNRGDYSVWFRKFNRGPIRYQALGACSFAVDMEFVFVLIP